MIEKKWSIKKTITNRYLILSAMAYAIMQIRLYIPFIISFIGILIAVIYISDYFDGIIEYISG